MTEADEKELKSETRTGLIDLTNRDPKQINERVIKVKFEDVIAEPEGIHSLNLVWKANYYTFKLAKNCCYRTLTAILSIPLSLLWGLLFACLSFLHIWAVVPCISSCLILFQCIFRPFLLLVRTFVHPLMEAAGKFYVIVKGSLRKDA